MQDYEEELLAEALELLDEAVKIFGMEDFKKFKEA